MSDGAGSKFPGGGVAESDCVAPVVGPVMTDSGGGGAGLQTVIGPANPEFPENMGAPLTPAWATTDFCVLLTEFLGPCAAARAVIAMLGNLAIGAVATPTKPFPDGPRANERSPREQMARANYEGGRDAAILRFHLSGNTIESRVSRKLIFKKNAPVLPTRISPESTQVGRPAF